MSPEDLPGRTWIAIFVFGVFFMFGASIFFERRPGPPAAVFYLIWLAFVAAAARSVVGRYFSTPTVVLERGVLLPAYLPRHWIRMGSRAVAFKDLRKVELDATKFRLGTHLFETAMGPKRVAKAYFPPAKRFAEELKRLAPEVEVLLIDRKGQAKRFAPVVTKRPPKQKPKGDRADAK